MTLKNNYLGYILDHLHDVDSINFNNLSQRLKSERKLLSTVFSVISEGVLIIDGSGLLVHANQSSKRLIGISNEDVGLLILWRLVPEIAKLFIVNHDVNFLKSRTTTRYLFISYPKKRFIKACLIRTTERNCKSSRELFIVIMLDITKSKLSIEDQKFSSIFSLTANVAHEICNPLNAISINLQLLTKQLNLLPLNRLSRDSLNINVSTCICEVNRLNDILNDFLKNVKYRSSEFENINLIKVIYEVVTVIAQNLKDLRISVSIIIDNKKAIVFADRNQIKQVFFNIFKNSAESIKGVGSINITTKNNKNYIIIKIRDTGCGIKKKDMRYIMDPYFTTKNNGYGLGMTLVKYFVRKNGGTIGIDSEIDIGTTIVLRFPDKGNRVQLFGNNC